MCSAVPPNRISHRNASEVAHTVLMPSGRQRTTVFNRGRPGDTLDIYAEELLDPARFIALDARQHTATATCAQLAA